MDRLSKDDVTAKIARVEATYCLVLPKYLSRIRCAAVSLAHHPLTMTGTCRSVGPLTSGNCTADRTFRL
jgi:hypothetical protein